MVVKMFQNAENLADGASLFTDICIIGAGPAGLTAAQEFLGSAVRVTILESGGLRGSARHQELSAGTLSGDLREPLEDTHLRQVGGTANHWIVRMAGGDFGYRFTPLTPWDFEPHPHQENSGWPIAYSDLAPYYARANAVCGIPKARYEPKAYETNAAASLPFAAERLVTRYFSFGATRHFNRRIPGLIAQAANIDLCYNATVVELIEDPSSGRVEAAWVRLFDGREIRLQARYFILACGGFQTARLLLCSDRHSPSGLGNRNDVVGRYLMDHSLVPSGNFYPKDATFLDRLALYDVREVEGAQVLGMLTLAEDLLRGSGLRNICFTLFPMPSRARVAALLALRNLLRDIRALRWPRAELRDVLRIAVHLPFVVRSIFARVALKRPFMPGFGMGGWFRDPKRHRLYERIELLAFAEQSPHPQNRITLTDETDALGMRRIKAHYTWSEKDLESIRLAQGIVAREFEALKLGRFEPDDGPAQPHIGALGLHHIMGTARMGDDPATSVVDSDCKVHGIANLFAASSAVFPTGGYANPTLTIMALAIRLADHIKGLPL